MSRGERFVVFAVPAAEPGTAEGMRFVEGTAAACVAALLDRLSLTELHALKLYGLLAAQKRVMRRTVAECAARVEAEARAESYTTPPAVPAAADAPSPDGLVVPDDDDKDDDDTVPEPTPLEVWAPDAGPRQRGGSR